MKVEQILGEFTCKLVGGMLTVPWNVFPIIVIIFPSHLSDSFLLRAETERDHKIILTLQNIDWRSIFMQRCKGKDLLKIQQMYYAFRRDWSSLRHFNFFNSLVPNCPFFGAHPSGDFKVEIYRILAADVNSNLLFLFKANPQSKVTAKLKAYPFSRRYRCQHFFLIFKTALKKHQELILLKKKKTGNLLY